MGFSLEWLAIKGATPDQACAALGAERTGTFANIHSAPLMGAELPSGYYLILSDYLTETVALHDRFVDDPRLGNEVISFMCDDTTMITQLQSWTNGQRNWNVLRIDPTEDFDVEGQEPVPFSEIYEKLQAEQQREDPLRESVDLIYDLTAELGKALTGFKHDEEPDPSIRFEVLELRPDSRFRVPSQTTTRAGTASGSGSATAKPWWKFW